MGCCMTKAKYENCEDKETLIEYMTHELECYEKEMDEEKSTTVATYYVTFVNDFKDVIGEVNKRKISNINKITDAISTFTDHFDKNKKIDDQYKKNLVNLKNSIRTQ